MRVTNLHQRIVPLPIDSVGALIDGLATKDDRLWPHEQWPRMAFDRPLAVGATGGHGPIGYSVESYRPGRLVRFRFHRPAGFDGMHEFVVEPDANGNARLTHRLVMEARGFAMLIWPLVFRPLHDALIEDSLCKAELALGLKPHAVAWSVPVRWLRRLAGVSSMRRPYPGERDGGQP